MKENSFVITYQQYDHIFEELMLEVYMFSVYYKQLWFYFAKYGLVYCYHIYT